MKEIFQIIYFSLDFLNKKLTIPKKVEDVKVISVGNICMGGTGKTPAVIYLAKQLAKTRAYKIGIVSRGYKSSISSKGAIISDGRNILKTCKEAGDEPFLMALNLPGIPIAVGKNKYNMAKKLVKAYKINMIILDDGFQHYRLFRKIDIVLLNAKDPFCKSNGFLREHPSSLKRSKIIILTHAQEISKKERSLLKNALKVISGHDKIFFSRYEIDSLQPIGNMPHSEYTIVDNTKIKAGLSMSSFLNHKEVYAISGIADPELFEDTIRRFGVKRVIQMRYPDHHAYSQKDLDFILQILPDKKIMITTEKDAVKLSDNSEIRAKKNLYVLKILFRLEEDQERMVEHLRSLVEKRD